MQFNGTKYGYIHNLQGDVIGLIDTSGNEVVKYVYDAWGKILSTTGSLASTLGAIQPFRYRSYVYDQETGLYYLRSRYYNPVWKRFINADAILIHNLFTYCQNNPLLNVDHSGHKSNSVSDQINRYLYSNEPEIVYCRSKGILGPVYALVAHLTSEEANAASNILFGDNITVDNYRNGGMDGTRANAFKHAYWNALMTRYLGSDIAKDIADAHEIPFANDSTLYVGIPNYEHSEMDYHNNRMGRIIGSSWNIPDEALEYVVYKYATSDLAYYRINEDGSIRSIDEARNNSGWQIYGFLETFWDIY